MPDFEFYRSRFGGQELTQEEFSQFAREGCAVLDNYMRRYRLVPVAENAREMAICQLAEVLAWFEWAASGGAAGGISVGSVAMTGVKSPDLSRSAKAQELYRAAGLYFDIYRGAQA